MTDFCADDAALVIEGLSFAYDSQWVLRDINLRVARGEFIGLIGPNAGGKSTLLKLILGLLEPFAGRVRVLVHPPRQARRRVGYVPQYPSFGRDFPITVEEVALMGRLGCGPLFGPYRPADRVAARRALAEVEADALRARPIGTLSGGQMQRVLLARALAGQPELLLLDEPTANIDHRVEGEVFELLARLQTRMTILVVSHDIAFISRYVHRVACLNRTLVCHATARIDATTIDRLYGEGVRHIAHGH